MNHFSLTYHFHSLTTSWLIREIIHVQIPKWLTNFHDIDSRSVSHNWFSNPRFSVTNKSKTKNNPNRRQFKWNETEKKNCKNFYFVFGGKKKLFSLTICGFRCCVFIFSCLLVSALISIGKVCADENQWERHVVKIPHRWEIEWNDARIGKLEHRLNEGIQRKRIKSHSYNYGTHRKKKHAEPERRKGERKKMCRMISQIHHN